MGIKIWLINGKLLLHTTIKLYLMQQRLLADLPAASAQHYQGMCAMFQCMWLCLAVVNLVHSCMC